MRTRFPLTAPSRFTRESDPDDACKDARDERAAVRFDHYVLLDGRLTA